MASNSFIERMLTVHDIDVYVKHLKDIATHLFLLFLIRYIYLKLIYCLQCKKKNKLNGLLCESYNFDDSLRLRLAFIFFHFNWINETKNLRLNSVACRSCHDNWSQTSDNPNIVDLTKIRSAPCARDRWKLYDPINYYSHNCEDFVQTQ